MNYLRLYWSVYLKQQRLPQCWQRLDDHPASPSAGRRQAGNGQIVKHASIEVPLAVMGKRQPAGHSNAKG